jgi:excisionase family DNA binding protein
MSAAIRIELPDVPALATLPEAAHALRTSTRTMRRLISMGRLQVVKLRIGGSARVLVPRVELERLVCESVL